MQFITAVYCVRWENARCRVMRVQRACPAEAGYTVRAPAEFGARNPAKPHAYGTGLGKPKTAAVVGELDARGRWRVSGGSGVCWRKLEQMVLAPEWINPVVLGSGARLCPPGSFSWMKGRGDGAVGDGGDTSTCCWGAASGSWWLQKQLLPLPLPFCTKSALQQGRNHSSV